MSYRKEYIQMCLPEKFDYSQNLAGYNFKPKGRKRAVRDRQKQQYEALQRQGCLEPHFDMQKVVVSYVTISKALATKVLIEKAGDILIREGFRPRRVFVGRAEFREMSNGMMPQYPHIGPFSFDFRMDFQRRQTRTPMDSPYLSEIIADWLDITVEVIPWMDGVLVI